MKRSLFAILFVFSVSVVSQPLFAEEADGSVDAETEAQTADGAGDETETPATDGEADSEEVSENTEAALDEAPEEVEPEASMEGLKALVDDGSYEDAYAQGQEMLFDHEGDREFDILYGTAANEVGESKEAVFIFERLVEDNPNDVRAKLELGKAYYQEGEREKAKTTFEEVLVSDQELPPNVEAKVVAYLSAIASGSEFGDPAKAETLKAFVGLAAGYDSNANAASDAQVINAYINGFVFPTANGTQEESTAYLSHQIAAAYVKPLNEKTAIDLKVFFSNRKNGSDLGALDTGNVFFELGNRWRFEKGLANFALRYSGITLGGDDLYDYTQLIAGWQQPLAWEYADSLGINFSTGSIKYAAAANEKRDINPTMLSLSLNRQIEQFIHTVSLTYGMDRAQNDHSYAYDVNLDGLIDPATELFTGVKADHYSRDYYGLGYTLSYLYDDKTVIYGDLVYQTSSYKDVDHDFLQDPTAPNPFAKRDGDLTELSVGARYNWSKELHFRGVISTREVTSDLDLYNYSKNKIELGAGYQL